MNEIPTPGIDALAFDLEIKGDAYLKEDRNPYGDYVKADDARRLEKELAELRAWKEEAQDLIVMKGTDHPATTEAILSNAGVFKGAHGLEGLANSQEFWDDKPYGKRLYYGQGGMDYLHRDVLQSAVKTLTTQSARIAELEGALKPFDISEAHLRRFEDTNNFTITRTAGQFRAITKALAAKGGETV